MYKKPDNSYVTQVNKVCLFSPILLTLLLRSSIQNLEFADDKKILLLLIRPDSNYSFRLQYVIFRK